jgi:hypothetical protein
MDGLNLHRVGLVNTANISEIHQCLVMIGLETGCPSLKHVENQVKLVPVKTFLVQANVLLTTMNTGTAHNTA